MAKSMNDDDRNDLDAPRLHRSSEDNAWPIDGEGNPDGEDLEDLEGLGAALRSYRAESLDWAEKKSATMPSPLPVGARADRPAWLQAPQWALGTAALCACVVGGALYTRHQSTLAEQAAAVLPAAPSQQVLADDNALLATVDDALRGSVAPSAHDLGLTGNDLLEESAPTRQQPQQRTN